MAFSLNLMEKRAGSKGCFAKICIQKTILVKIENQNGL